MIEPRTEINPAPPTAGVTAARRTERPLGDRVRSLSLAQIPDRRYSLAAAAAWIVGLVAIAAGGWYGYTRYTSRAAAEPSPTALGEQPTANATARASSGSQTPTSPRPQQAAASSLSPNEKGDVVLESKGYIVPAHQILVSPKVSGMIVQLNVEEGRRVAKGEVLAVLESTDYA